MAADPSRSARRTDALSRERVIAAAIEILDGEGESALTFRSLATHLSTGTGSIYWYLANKDELIAATTSAVIAQALGSVAPRADARENIRAIAAELFDTIDAHPWVGSQLSRDPWRLGATQIFEAVGGGLGPLGVPREARFDAASALTSYIVGSASQNAAHSRSAPRGVDRDAFLAGTTERWAKLDPTEYPFVQEILAQLPEHDDRAQFLAGLDLILAGIELGPR